MNGGVTVNKENGRAYSRNWIIILCSLVYFVSYFSRKDFAAAMAGMISEGVIGRTNAGLVGTMLFVFYGLGQLISGYLGDKVSPKYLIFLGLSVTGACNALMNFVPETLMIAVWGVNGLAQAMLWPPIVKLLSYYLDHKTYVTANLIVTSAAHVATVLLYLFVPFCLSFMSWRTVFTAASILAFAAFAIFAVAMRLILPDKPQINPRREECAADEEKRGVKRGVFGQMKETGILTVLVSIVVVGFLRDGIESWLPMLYSEAFGRDVAESTLVSIILPVFSIISISVVTVLHRKGTFNNEVSGSLILFAFSLVCSALLALFVSLSGTVFGVLSLVLAALICAAMHGANFLLISCLPGRFSKLGRAATVSGVCNSCVYIGAAVSTYGIALLSGALGWSLTVAVWCVILVVGIVSSLLSYKKYKTMIND